MAYDEATYRRQTDDTGDDPRQELLRSMAEAHADASLGRVTGSDYMVEHWLAAYATLYLTA